VGNWAADPGDVDILAYAAANGAVLVTIDKDFGELAIVRMPASLGMWGLPRAIREPLPWPRS